MRDVYIEGKKYQIPGNAKYVVMEKRGACYSFEGRPSCYSLGGLSLWLGDGSEYFFGWVTDPSRYDWRKTLTEVPRNEK